MRWAGLLDSGGHLPALTSSEGTNKTAQVKWAWVITGNSQRYYCVRRRRATPQFSIPSRGKRNTRRGMVPLSALHEFPPSPASARLDQGHRYSAAEQFPGGNTVLPIKCAEAAFPPTLRQGRIIGLTSASLTGIFKGGFVHLVWQRQRISRRMPPIDQGVRSAASHIAEGRNGFLCPRSGHGKWKPHTSFIFAEGISRTGNLGGSACDIEMDSPKRRDQGIPLPLCGRRFRADAAEVSVRQNGIRQTDHVGPWEPRHPIRYAGGRASRRTTRRTFSPECRLLTK